MRDLLPLTPLGGHEPREDRIGAYLLTEMPEVEYASVAARLGREEEAARAVAGLIGAEAPGPLGWAGGDTLAFWTSPDAWMIEAPLSQAEDLAARVNGAAGDAASVTEQSGAWARFDVEGDLPALLSRLCALDMEAAESGFAARTTIDHLGCYVLVRAKGRASVIGPRSSAASLHHALTTAMRSVTAQEGVAR